MILCSESVENFYMKIETTILNILNNQNSLSFQARFLTTFFELQETIQLLLVPMKISVHLTSRALAMPVRCSPSHSLYLCCKLPTLTVSLFLLHRLRSVAFSPGLAVCRESNLSSNSQCLRVIHVSDRL